MKSIKFICREQGGISSGFVLVIGGKFIDGIKGRVELVQVREIDRE